ncbi:MAG: rhomboid family intramembrane serine protease [Deltaproteobacteria bacterium]|nr:rhomboid family intramembrane serine protease [Deltaproteobacteria bacterium]
MDDKQGQLRSPTMAGQTGMLARVEGSLAAAVLWEELPYWMRARWAAAAGEARPDLLVAYVQLQASPVALDAAIANERLPPEVREAARERLAEIEADPDLRARLQRHFKRLVDGSRKRLLVRLSTASGADAELDRTDLLAEIIALRGLKNEVASERSLARAFRAMFVAKNAVVLYVIAALCVAAFIAVAAMDDQPARELRRSLALYPDLTRPWTLLTYPWLHLNLGHLVLNVGALVLVGQVLEQVLGHRRFALAFIGCAVGAGLASVLFKTVAGIHFYTVGASGAIAGLAGMALFLGFWFQSRYGRIPIRYSGGTLLGGLLLASNMLLAAASGDLGADHGAHVGGLLIGLTAGFLARGRLAESADRTFAVAMAAR